MYNIDKIKRGDAPYKRKEIDMFKQKLQNFSDDRVREALEKRNYYEKQLTSQVERVLAAKEYVDLWDNEVMKKDALEKYKKEKELLLVFTGDYDNANFEFKDTLRKEQEHMSYTLHVSFRNGSEIVFNTVLGRM